MTNAYRLKCNVKLTKRIVNILSDRVWEAILDRVVYVCTDSKLDGESVVVPVVHDLAKTVYAATALRTKYHPLLDQQPEDIQELHFEVRAIVLDYYTKYPDRLMRSLARTNRGKWPWDIQTITGCNEALLTFKD